MSFPSLEPSVASHHTKNKIQTLRPVRGAPCDLSAPCPPHHPCLVFLCSLFTTVSQCWRPPEWPKQTRSFAILGPLVMLVPLPALVFAVSSCSWPSAPSSHHCSVTSSGRPFWAPLPQVLTCPLLCSLKLIAFRKGNFHCHLLFAGLFSVSLPGRWALGKNCACLYTIMYMVPGRMDRQ